MHTFAGRSANDVYADAIATCMERGTLEPVARANAAAAMTRELHPVLFALEKPHLRLVTAYGRPVNVAFAMAEVLWILTGQRNVEMLAAYNSQIANYSDDGTTFNAPYGYRLRHEFGHDQLEDMIEGLGADSTSRQAVSVIWSPDKDRAFLGSGAVNVTKDRACNISSMLLIRDGKLDWTQTMRSNDALWGWPYNVIQWTMLQEYVAWRLEIELGTYYHLSNSFHIYEHQWADADQIAPFDIYEHYAPRYADFTNIAAAQRAEADLRTLRRIDFEGLSDFWRDCLRLWAAHHAYKAKQDAQAIHLLGGMRDLTLAAAQLRFYWTNRWSKSRDQEITEWMTQLFVPEVAAWIMGDDVSVS